MRLEEIALAPILGLFAEQDCACERESSKGDVPVSPETEGVYEIHANIGLERIEGPQTLQYSMTHFSRAPILSNQDYSTGIPGLHTSVGSLGII